MDETSYLEGADIDVLFRATSAVRFISCWQPDYPEPLHAYWRMYRQLCDEAEKRFHGQTAALILIRRFIRRADAVVGAAASADAPIPPFDVVYVCEPLTELIDQLSLGEPVNGPDPKRTEKLSKEARALAALVDHPEWTDEQIAEAAGCSRQSLYRMTKFVAAKQMLKDGKNRMPKGSKNAETGTMQAWHEDMDDE